MGLYISVCPWCGNNMPDRLRQTYYDVLLREYNLDCPDDDELPPSLKEFLSDAWWKKRRLDRLPPLMQVVENRDLLKELHEGTLTEEKAREEFEKLFQSHHQSLLNTHGCYMGYLSMMEYSAFMGREITLYTLARWRYEGWPNRCPVCQKKVNLQEERSKFFEQFSLNGRKLGPGILHYDCYETVNSTL